MMFRHVIFAVTLILTPLSAWAQCAGGLLSNCPAAVSPQTNDLVYGWQPGQTPHSRSFTLTQIGTAVVTIPFASPPPLGNVTPNTGAFTSLSATGAATVNGNVVFGNGSTVKGTLAGGGGGASLTLSGGTNATYSIINDKGTLAQFSGTSNTNPAVNLFQLKSSPTGAHAQFFVAGPSSDANTNLDFIMKGTGGVTFGNNAGITTLAPVTVGNSIIGAGKTITYAGTPSNAQSNLDLRIVPAGNVPDPIPPAVNWQSIAQIISLGDTATAPVNAGGIRGLYISMSNGAGSVGNRLPLDVVNTVTAGNPTTVGNGGAPLAARFTTNVNASLGGAPGAPLGAPFGVDIELSTNGVGAANPMTGIYGMEIGVSNDSASVITRRAGIQIVDKAAGGTRGTAWDYAIGIATNDVVQGWNNIFQVGGTFGGWPGDNNTTLFKVQHGATDATLTSNYGRGIDLWEGIPNEFQFRGIGPFLVDASGNVMVGTGLIKPLSTGISIDVTGSVGTAVALNAAGTGYVAGEWIYFATGGAAKINTIGAGGSITSLSALFRAPYVESGAVPCTTGCATTAQPGSNGSGATVDITWATTRNQLDLNPSGGLTTAGGAFKPKNTVVASLPTCNAGAKYQTYAVSDASAPTYGAALAGGGAVVALAVCDGTNWTAH